MRVLTALTVTAVALASAGPGIAAPTKATNATNATKKGAAVKIKATKSAAPAEPAAPAPSVSLTMDFVSPKRWTMRLANTGDEPLRIVADPSLLSFELPSAPAAPSAGKKPSRCALPADMRPADDVGRAVILLPGKTYKESFDPRLFCFDVRTAASLVPGAKVVAHYGFGPKGKNGPYAVAPIPTPEGATSVSPLREVVSAPLELGADAVAAKPPASAPPPADDFGARLAITMSPRVDGGRASELLATVTLQNLGTRATAVYFRPQTLGFDITGPSGETTCPATGASALRELFTTLAANKGKAQVGVLLAASCAGPVFDVPGLYEVRVRLDTRKVAGSPETLHAFDGEVIATSPSLVRVRTGRPGAPKPPPMVE